MKIYGCCFYNGYRPCHYEYSLYLGSDRIGSNAEKYRGNEMIRRRYVKRNRNGVRTYAIGRFKVNSLRRMKIKLGNNKELYS